MESRSIVFIRRRHCVVWRCHLLTVLCFGLCIGNPKVGFAIRTSESYGTVRWGITIGLWINGTLRSLHRVDSCFIVLRSAPICIIMCTMGHHTTQYFFAATAKFRSCVVHLFCPRGTVIMFIFVLPLLTFNDVVETFYW